MGSVTPARSIAVSPIVATAHKVTVQIIGGLCTAHGVTQRVHAMGCVCVCACLQVTYEQALAAIFIEALIFIFISLIGLRGRLIELVPKHIMLATAVGIGEPRAWPANSLGCTNTSGPLVLLESVERDTVFCLVPAHPL